MPATPMHPGSGSWASLRGQVRLQTAGLVAPGPAGPGQCRTCRGPARGGYTRCFQCVLHTESAPGSLADVVVPIGYAPKGGRLARQLWEYKSAAQAQAQARARRWLRALLLVFLHDHGPCVWRGAAMPAPTHVAVVPSCRGRPGPHPLAALIAPYLALPWAGLAVATRDGPGGHDLDPGRFRAAGPLPGATVLLLDDTWTSGGSAQGAVAALRAAGARHVAVVVLGRHLNWPREPPAGAASLGRPFRLDRCAVHESAESRWPGPAGRGRHPLVAPINRLDP
jgi:hypothetical protein